MYALYKRPVGPNFMYMKGTDTPHLPIIVLDVRGMYAPQERPAHPGFMYVRGTDAPHLPIIMLDVRGTYAPTSTPAPRTSLRARTRPWTRTTQVGRPFLSCARSPTDVALDAWLREFFHLFPEVGQKQKFKKKDAGFVDDEPDDLF